jgi:excisionase family DNA binding protein
MNKLLTVKETAEYLSIHPNTIYKWTEGGKVPHIKINGQVRFERNTIESWLKTYTYKPSQTPDILPNLENKLDISLKQYDNLYLKGDSGLNKIMARWKYVNGIVYLRRNPGGSKSWGIEYRDENGRRKQRIVPNAQSRGDALIALNKHVREVFELQNSVYRPKKIKFCEFADIYLHEYALIAKKSGETDAYRLRKIKQFFKDVELRNITPMKIQKFRAERLKEGVSKTTTNREIQLLKKMFNVAIEESYLEENPAKKIKLYSELDSVRDRVLSEEEQPRLFKELAEHMKPLILAALHTGMREGELLKLRWQNVDFEKRQIKVEMTKSKKTRFIPINSVLFDELERLKLKRVEEQRVFPFKYIQKAWENARRRAGLEDLTFHDLRRTFGTRLLEAGVDIVTISKLYGHSSISVTQRYLHPKDKLSKEAVELLVKDPSDKLKEREKLLQICDTKMSEQSKKLAIQLFSMN